MQILEYLNLSIHFSLFFLLVYIAWRVTPRHYCKQYRQFSDLCFIGILSLEVIETNVILEYLMTSSCHNVWRFAVSFVLPVTHPNKFKTCNKPSITCLTVDKTGYQLSFYLIISMTWNSEVYLFELFSLSQSPFAIQGSRHPNNKFICSVGFVNGSWPILSLIHRQAANHLIWDLMLRRTMNAFIWIWNKTEQHNILVVLSVCRSFSAVS